MINAIDMETGEITREDIVYSRTRQEQEMLERFKNIKLASSGMNFFFIFYGFKDVKDSPLSKLSSQSFARLMYLASYCSYDNNRLVLDGNKIPIKFKTLQPLMQLGRKVYYEFRKDIVDNELVTEDTDKCLMLNPKYFSKGRIKTKSNDYMRVYIDTIRKLYETNPRTKDMQLGYVYKLIPYVNRHYHIICFNPYEKDVAKLNLMSLSEFCEIVGSYKENETKMEYNLSTIKIDNQPIIAFISNKTCKNKMIFTNPKLFSICGNDQVSNLMDKVFGNFEKCGGVYRGRDAFYDIETLVKH